MRYLWIVHQRQTVLITFNKLPLINGDSKKLKNNFGRRRQEEKGKNMYLLWNILPT